MAEPEPDPNLVKMADEAMAMGVDTNWNSDKEFPLSFDTESTQPSAEYREALLVLDDTTYLHVQPYDTGWDYTLYDAATMKQLDGGQLDVANMGRSEAIGHICEDLGMGSKSIKYAPLSMIETLQETAYQQMQEQVSQQTAETATAQLPDDQELALDEYPMPDSVLTQDDLEKCGYLDGDLLPLSKERAYELMERDLTVYIVQEGENPEMAFDTTDLDAHDGIFAISREEWEESPEFDKLVKDRMDHQEEREQAFLSHKGDCFAIYQVKHTDELRDIRYEGLEWLQSIGRTVQRENYELVYEEPMTEKDNLESIYTRFNVDRPADFTGHSLSVSDIVVLHQGGKDTAHYCDRAGFSEVPEFLQPAQKSREITERIQTPRGSFYLCGMTREQMEADGYGFHHASEDGKYLIMANGTQAYAVRADAPEKDNPLRTAEMTLEDDYGMIDGVINNGRRGEELEKAKEHAERTQPEKKPSIRERLEQGKKECAEKSKAQPHKEKSAPEL